MTAQDLVVSKHLGPGSQVDEATVLKLTVKEASNLPNMDVIRSSSLLNTFFINMCTSLHGIM